MSLTFQEYTFLQNTPKVYIFHKDAAEKNL